MRLTTEMVLKLARAVERVAGVRLEKGEEKQRRAAEPTAPAKLGDEDE